jgi:hypothetical protein
MHHHSRCAPLCCTLHQSSLVNRGSIQDSISQLRGSLASSQLTSRTLQQTISQPEMQQLLDTQPCLQELAVLALELENGAVPMLRDWVWIGCCEGANLTAHCMYQVHWSSRHFLVSYTAWMVL